jgi:hypothetical protein
MVKNLVKVQGSTSTGKRYMSLFRHIMGARSTQWAISHVLDSLLTVSRH